MADKQNSDKKPVDYGEVLVEALKRTPGNIAGGGVDVANLLLGLLTGKGLKGFVDKPVGGSESINQAVGLKQGQDPAQQAAEAVLGMFSPGSMATQAAKTAGIGGAAVLGMLKTLNAGGARPAGKSASQRGMIIPAVGSGKSDLTVKELTDAQKLIAAGKEAEAYDKYKVFIPAHPAYGGELLRVIDDSKNRLTSNRLVSVPGQESDLSMKMLEAKGGTPASFVGESNRDMYDYASLGNLLNAPELYLSTSKIVPELKNIPVVGSMYGQPPIAPGTGYYYPGEKAIGLGPASPFALHSTLLHEIQHAIAEAAGLPAGMPGGHRSLYGGQEITNKFLSAKKQTDKLPDNDPRRQAMQSASEEAFSGYMTDPGEVLSRITQRMFETGNYLVSPNELMKRPELTPFVFMGPPKTLSPEIQQIIQQFTGASKP